MPPQKPKRSLSRIFRFYLILFAIIPPILVGIYGTYRAYTRFTNEADELRQEFTSSMEQELIVESGNFVRHIDYQVHSGNIKLRTQISTRVEEAHATAQYIYDAYRGKVPQDELEQKVIDALRPIRYNNGRCYFFIYNLDGVAEMTPNDPSLEGSNQLNLTDENGKFIIKDMIEIANIKHQGFLEYVWYQLGQREKQHRKVAFVKKFQPFNWFIGSGEYLENVKKDIQKDIILQLSQIQPSPGTQLTIISEGGQHLLSTDQNGPVVGGFWETETGRNATLLALEIAHGGNQGFFSATWDRKNASSDLLFYPAKVTNWNWLVVIGRSFDHLDAQILKKREQLRTRTFYDLLQGSIALIILMIVTLLIARVVTLKMQAGFDRFSSFFEKASRDHTWLDPDRMRFAELQSLAEQANRMTIDRNRAEEMLKRSKQKLKTANSELERLASLDGLTGIPNRRSFDRRLEEEWERGRGTQLSVIMMDLDYFKKYNDTYGHQQGDEALRVVAQVLRTGARGSGDFPARYGGEEFVMILPLTDTAGAVAVAERIRTKIADLKREHKGSEICDHMTLSLGVACCTPGPSESMETLLTQADEALYHAKKMGRNCVGTYDPTSEKQVL